MPNYEPLLYWIRERENIRSRKGAGLPQAEWTSDPILAKYRFCNVRREDDLGTIWIRENIREPFADHFHLWFMLCIARQINWPKTLQRLINNEWPASEGFNPERMRQVLNAIKAKGEKVYTGAYMISAPPSGDKQTYIANVVLGALWQDRTRLTPLFSNPLSLQQAHATISAFKGWGPFMAYQAVVDMRFTKILRSAPDVESWAAAGPGTIRGLNRLYSRPLKQALSQAQALEEMRLIYPIIYKETGVSLDFSDIPNALCETDKYLRVKCGDGTPRALYVAGRGS